MKNKLKNITLGILIITWLFFIFLWPHQNKPNILNFRQDNKNQTSDEGRKYADNFLTIGALEETGSINEPGNNNWYLNSGAYAYYKNGILSTIQGNIDPSSRWLKLYKASSPEDTDGGTHPQNLFRLVQRDNWKNFKQEAYFRINNYNLSNSENRNQSNGFLLFNRYQDGDNLYYAGLRVDGYAVIKKKYKGSYYTLSTKQVIDEKYDRAKKPNVIPTGNWVGVKSRVSDFEEDKVKIELFIDMKGTNEWTKVLEAIDDGKSFGGPVINYEGHGGMRTDFMDVDFRDYKISEIQP